MLTNAIFFLFVVIVASAVGIYFLVKKIPEPDSVFGKAVEVLMGLFGWYAINGITWFLLQPPLDTPNAAMGNVVGRGYGSVLFSGLLIPFNIIFLLIYAVIPRTRMIALGMLVAIALNFLISLLLGMTMNAFCFIPFFHK